MNIVLCGMMGVGKTSVGIEIAKKFERCWVDTDDIITERYGKITDIFEYYGEEYFRNIESDIIKEVAERENMVISTGGGAVIREINVATFKNNNCIIVYLRADGDTILNRVSSEENSRPLLAKRSIALREHIENLMSVRTPIYERAADFIVDTDNKSISEVAEEVVSLAEGR